MKKITVSILTTLLMLSMVFSSSVFAANEEKTSAWDSFLGLFSAKTAETSDVGVEYRGHIQNVGNYPLDGSWVQGPTELGTEGQSLRLEGFWIKLNGDVPADANIKYNVHVQNIGWMEDEDDTTDWPANGEFAGTEGKSLQIEAIKIVLVDDEGVQLEDYSVVYSGHVQNVGDVGPFTNGETLGTVGAFQRLEAIEVDIVQNPADLTEYEAALAAVTQADYTAASWTTYQAVVNANVVDEDNLQSEVDAATANITAAQANLVKALKVESASALNASQLQVVFNGPVSKDSAELTTNYLANNVTVSNASSIFGGASTTAKLQADGKTVIIEAPAGGNFISNGSSFTLKVKNVKATDGITIAPDASFVVTLNDAAGPVAQSVTAAAGTSTTKSVKVTFNEPVKNIGAYTVAGQAASAVINSKDTKVVDLTTNQALTAGQTYTLVITGVGDGVNTSAAQSVTFTVSSDVVAPVVTSVTQLGGQLAVTFDKEISASDLAGLLIGNNVTSDSITLAKTGSTTPYVSAANLDPDDKHIVLLNIVSSVYGSGTTASAELKVSNVKDVNGNKMAVYTQTVSLTKDTTKPTLVSSKMSTATTQDIILEFSEAVNVASFTGTNVTVVNNSTGADVSATYGTPITAVVVKSDGTAVAGGVTTSKYVKLTMEAVLPAATYTITIPADVVVDTSSNKMAQTQFSVTANSSQDSTKPTVLTATNAVAGQNIITVTFSENVQLSDARNTANYILAGNALPAGTEIVNTSVVSTDTNKFDIRIPNDGITADNAAASFIVSSVKDIAGNVMVTQSLPTIGIRDTKAPTLVSAKATAATTLELTFSEPVAQGAVVNNNVTVGSVASGVAPAVTIVGSKATITMPTMGGVDFTTANLAMAANAFKDLAATPNNNLAIVAGDGIKVTDGFADVTGATVATKAGVAVNSATDITVNIKRPTNYDVDRVAQYDIYIVREMATPYTKVSEVEALTKLATFGPALADNTDRALPATVGSTFSDGTAIAGSKGADVTTYIVITDEAGNKTLLTQATATL